MLESRIKVWFGEEMNLSIQHRLDCNFLTEGCRGGWGYFDGLFLEQYGAIDATCGEPYAASTTPDKCGGYSECEYKAGVKDTYYVGGRAYGKVTEQALIKELRSRGPVQLDFNAGFAYFGYKSGIMSEENPISEAFKAQSQVTEVA